MCFHFWGSNESILGKSYKSILYSTLPDIAHVQFVAKVNYLKSLEINHTLNTYNL